jgi:hypothetical protein
MPSKTLKRGSRRQVWNGTAEQTAGGLTKEQLEKNKRGRIVSKKKTARMTTEYKGSDSDEPEKQEPVKGGFWSMFE